MRRVWNLLMLVVLLVFAAFASPALALAQEWGADFLDVPADNVVTVVTSGLFLVAAVEVIKRQFGLTGTPVWVVAILLGVTLQLAGHYLGDYEVFRRAMIGVLNGGAAAGGYVLAGRVAGR